MSPPPKNGTINSEEEALKYLISNSESRPLTYLLSRFLISNLELRVEKEGSAGERLLFSKREIGNILRSPERWLIWEKIHELKATSIPELVEVLSCDDQTAWRVVKPLEKMRILRVTNKLTHPRGRGNETEILSLVDASPEASVDAAARARSLVGVREEQTIRPEYVELAQTLLAKHQEPQSSQWWDVRIKETRPEIPWQDRAPIAKYLCQHQPGGSS